MFYSLPFGLTKDKDEFSGQVLRCQENLVFNKALMEYIGADYNPTYFAYVDGKVAFKSSFEDLLLGNFYEAFMKEFYPNGGIRCWVCSSDEFEFKNNEDLEFFNNVITNVRESSDDAIRTAAYMFNNNRVKENTND